MEELIRIFEYENKKVRTVEINGETWFVLKDICEVLELSNPTMVAERLDKDERSKSNLGRQGEMLIINETGLYKVILRSDKPQAKPFINWVTKQVLPSIRKTGEYSTLDKNEKDIINQFNLYNPTIYVLPEKQEETKGINMDFKIDDLKKMLVWVNWKLEERDGKKTKVPYNPRTGGKAMSNNRDTWTTFDFAQSKSADYSGIGFMFADGICGIDIDNKTGNLELGKQAETIINLMDTYTERSPSGTGWHIIFKCDMSKIPTVDGKLDGKYYYKNPHNDLECYFPGLTNRYFTYTGQGNGKNIEDRTEQVLIFIENYMLKDNFKAKNDRQERTETAQTYQTSTDTTS